MVVIPLGYGPSWRILNSSGGHSGNGRGALEWKVTWGSRIAKNAQVVYARQPESRTMDGPKVSPPCSTIFHGLDKTAKTEDGYAVALHDPDPDPVFDQNSFYFPSLHLTRVVLLPVLGDGIEICSFQLRSDIRYNQDKT